MERQPATLLISVTPDSTIGLRQISTSPGDDDIFRRFIGGCLSETADMDRGPDTWFFRYDFPDSTPLMQYAMNPAGDRSLRTVCRMASQAGIRPARVVRLRDARYCQREGLDPLAFDPGTIRRSGDSSPGEFPTCRAVDTGRGVLLYDLEHPAGREAYRAFMQHCADRFFDPGMDIERMRLYDLHRCFDFSPLEERLAALNFDFRHRGHGFTMRDLHEMPLLGQEILQEGVAVGSYDMRPLAENYSRFVSEENVLLYNTHHTFSIAVLDHVARHGYPTWELTPEWVRVCPLSSQFDDLAGRIVSCRDSQQMDGLQDEARARAARLLDDCFPERRKALLPTEAETVEQEIYHIPELPTDNNRLKLS